MIDKRVEQAVKYMKDVANNNAHGYDQQYRWNEYGDFDCSSLTITAFQNSGIPLKDMGATYTGNMSNALKKLGFKNVISYVNLNTGEGMKRGDILLNIYYHVAVYCGNGKLVQASINELGKATGGKAGDQTGREINISNYYLYKRGWHEVWRFPEVQEKKKETTTMSEKERGYAVKAINKLAELGVLNSPDVHIKNIDKSNWAQWVVLAKLAEKINK